MFVAYAAEFPPLLTQNSCYILSSESPTLTPTLNSCYILSCCQQLCFTDLPDCVTVSQQKHAVTGCKPTGNLTHTANLLAVTAVAFTGTQKQETKCNQPEESHFPCDLELEGCNPIFLFFCQFLSDNLTHDTVQASKV